MDRFKRWFGGVQWSAVLHVPVGYLLLAWLVWVIANVLRRRKVLFQPVIFVLDDEGRQKLRALLYDEMKAAGLTYSGENQTGMYWRRREHED